LGLLERIRHWLSATAKGELHAYDQPLEPFITSTYSLIIPHDLNENVDGRSNLLVVRKTECGDKTTLIASRLEVTNLQKGEAPYVAVVFETSPVVHGVINHSPASLLDLHQLLGDSGADLLQFLRMKLPELKEDRDWEFLKAQLVLVISVPKKREIESKPETSELLAFLIPYSVEEIGEEIGIWCKFNNALASMALSPDLAKDGSNIAVIPVNPVKTLSRESALSFCGIEPPVKQQYVVVGVGALGSQFLMHLVRMGVGKWVTVDDDFLLPHNICRHALDSSFIGTSKAEAVAMLANSCLDETAFVQAIVADVLAPGVKSEMLKTSFSMADVIVDASTSIPVARHLARDVSSEARRISIFLSPTGMDSVILAEDGAREIQIDFLEMQYYRALLHAPELSDHLQVREKRVRYARTCRDVSFVLSQEAVGLHSSLCARGFRQALSSEKATIGIWRSNEAGSVNYYNFETAPVYKATFGDWTLYYDEFIVNKIYEARAARLPNETGGILLGSFDLQRKVVYAVDTILSPPDSKEWPTTYIRGCTGLVAEVEMVKKTTMSMLDYVGEWHAHPGRSTSPSGDDIKAFQWLVDIMDICGQPAMMVIAGESNQSWYLGEMR